MTIQIGQFSTQSQYYTTSRLIENQLTAAERFNVPSFRLSVLREMGLPEPTRDSARSKEIFDTLRSTPAKSNDLINVQVSAHSRDEAVKALKASFDLFNGEHRKVYDPAVARLNEELKRLTAKLDLAEREYTKTLQSLQPALRGIGKAESRDVLQSSTAATLSQQVLELNRQKADLEDALTPLRTYPTRPFGELYAPDRSLTPSTLAIIAMGIAAGLAVGIAGVMLTHSVRRARSTAALSDFTKQ
ncbi:hypothetical protein [Cupriavidus nantongensis]|uniref:hypothetical protein n=1 Tax=Cupriavidus nantongensis TaxID=1796606 RepID=UPI002247A6C3|nr:hypothetical protein [Cupriavidus nantongensis]